MININEVKQYAEFLAKKWQSGAILSPDQFNLVIPNVVLEYPMTVVQERYVVARCRLACQEDDKM